jgi:transposase
MDVHPSCFSAAAVRGNAPNKSRIEWTHDRVAMERLEVWAGRHLRPGDIVVMEAGNSSFETCTRLRGLGFASVVLESFRAGQIASAYLKNDKVDAVKLAKIYLSGLAKEVWQPDETCRERREILAAFRKAVADSVRMRNRITSWLTEHGKRKPPRIRWTRPEGRQWLLSCREWSDGQAALIQTMLDDLCLAESKRKKLERLIAKTVTHDPEMLKLTRICGIRHITAYALAAVIGDISRFRSPKKLVAYLGLNPKVCDSGIHKGPGRLAHNGRGDLRALIVQGAQAVLRQNPGSNELARWGQALGFRKNRNTAVIAVARKMITAVWYLMRGFYSKLIEADASLTRKITKIATVIGRDMLQQLGYSKTHHFVKEKLQLLISTS